MKLILTILLLSLMPSVSWACFAYCGMTVKKLGIIYDEIGNKYIIEYSYDPVHHIHANPDTRYQIRSSTGKLLAWLPRFDAENMAWSFTCPDLDHCTAYTYTNFKAEKWQLSKAKLLESIKDNSATYPEKFKEEFETYLNNNKEDFLYTPEYYGSYKNDPFLNFEKTEYGFWLSQYYFFKYMLFLQL